MWATRAAAHRLDALDAGTRVAYESKWVAFTAFCMKTRRLDAAGRPTADADTLAAFVAFAMANDNGGLVWSAGTTRSGLSALKSRLLVR